MRPSYFAETTLHRPLQIPFICKIMSLHDSFINESAILSSSSFSSFLFFSPKQPIDSYCLIQQPVSTSGYLSLNSIKIEFSSSVSQPHLRCLIAINAESGQDCQRPLQALPVSIVSATHCFPLGKFLSTVSSQKIFIFCGNQGGREVQIDNCQNYCRNLLY